MEETKVRRCVLERIAQIHHTVPWKLLQIQKWPLELYESPVRVLASQKGQSFMVLMSPAETESVDRPRKLLKVYRKNE
jgi:hypothetical protein